jgi:hypothetical protein
MPDLAPADILDQLAAAEAALSKAEQQRLDAEKTTAPGVILDTTSKTTRRGGATTGLEAKVVLSMPYVPTAIYHLFDAETRPLITCEVKAVKRKADDPPKRRVRVTSFIEGYSAHAVDTFEIANNETYPFKQLPTLFLDRVRDLTELSRATVNVLVEDLDGKVEMHVTEPVWMLARTTLPYSVLNPQTGAQETFFEYYGAYVTPNAPSLMRFLREAASLHPQHTLGGYQPRNTLPEQMDQIVTPQVKALYAALKAAGITYVNSVLNVNPQQGVSSQRVRLPRESLADREANCIDGTVLFASLLEGISINAAICAVPGHAFLAWETWDGYDDWRYLETTMIGSSSFEDAVKEGKRQADDWERRKQLKRLPLRDLRAQKGIVPME